MNEPQIAFVRDILKVRLVALTLAINHNQRPVLVAAIDGDDVAVVEAINREILLLKVNLENATRATDSSATSAEVERHFSRSMMLTASLEYLESVQVEAKKCAELLKKPEFKQLLGQTTPDLMAMIDEFEEAERTRAN